AKRTQVQSEGIRTLIQFIICQPIRPALNCNIPRSPFNLVLEQLMKTSTGRIVHFGIVQADKQIMPLLGAKHLQLTDCCLRVIDSTSQQSVEFLSQPLHPVFGKQSRVVMKFCSDCTVADDACQSYFESVEARVPVVDRKDKARRPKDFGAIFTIKADRNEG